MSKQKAWWKKISIRSITGFVGTASDFLRGGSAAASRPPASPVVLSGPNIAGLELGSPMVLALAVGAVVLLIIFTRKGR